MTGPKSTLGAMHVATGLMSFALAQALQGGAERARGLAAEDRAHARGRRAFTARVQERIEEQNAEAEAAAIMLMRNRKKLHG